MNNSQPLSLSHVRDNHPCAEDTSSSPAERGPITLGPTTRKKSTFLIMFQKSTFLMISWAGCCPARHEAGVARNAGHAPALFGGRGARLATGQGLK